MSVTCTGEANKGETFDVKISACSCIVTKISSLGDSFHKHIERGGEGERERGRGRERGER